MMDFIKQRLKSDPVARKILAMDETASLTVDVYFVIRQTDETTGGQTIRWMNVTRYLKARKDKKSRPIVFAGEKLDVEAVWKVRDGFFSPR